MPTTPGAYTPLIEVRANGRAVSVARPLRVSRLTGSLEISARALPAPTRSVPYRASLGAAGGAGGYRYGLIDGILPVGLTLSAAGEISGTPTDPLGTMRGFIIRVTDAIGNVDERSYALTVVDAAPFTIQTRSLPDAMLGEEYLQSIFAVNPGGAAVSQPVSWRVISGEFPEGLQLEPSQSDTVVISGTPTRPGRFRFTAGGGRRAGPHRRVHVLHLRRLGRDHHHRSAARRWCGRARRLGELHRRADARRARSGSGARAGCLRAWRSRGRRHGEAAPYLPTRRWASTPSRWARASRPISCSRWSAGRSR